MTDSGRALREAALSPSATEPVPVSAHSGNDQPRVECGSCGPVEISAEAFDLLWQSAEAEKAKRAADMPTEQDAINLLWQAYQRLKELDWNDPIYCPKDGSEFDIIEAGSTGIFKAHYEGEWPTGSWWVSDGGDLWPSRPTLYRRTEAEKARWADIGKAVRRDRDASLAEDAKRLSPEGVAARARQGIAQPETPHPKEASQQ